MSKLLSRFKLNAIRPDWLSGMGAGVIVGVDVGVGVRVDVGEGVGVGVSVGWVKGGHGSVSE